MNALRCRTLVTEQRLNSQAHMAIALTDSLVLRLLSECIPLCFTTITLQLTYY